LRNMVTFIKMFDDRLVIESPGGFPPNVTPETIYFTHSPRNPRLMNALFFMAYVKCHNEGTRRMRDSMDQSNLPRPEFAQKEVVAGYNSVRVTLKNNIKLRKLAVDSEATRILDPAVWRTLNKTEMRILNYVAEHKSINVTQAQKLFQTEGSRWHSLKKILQGMAERGLLEHHHSKIVERDSRACYTLPGPKAEAKHETTTATTRSGNK
jgi:ATP-dependent DNA helicase RecG